MVGGPNIMFSTIYTVTYLLCYDMTCVLKTSKGTEMVLRYNVGYSSKVENIASECTRNTRDS